MYTQQQRLTAGLKHWVELIDLEPCVSQRQEKARCEAKDEDEQQSR